MTAYAMIARDSLLEVWEQALRLTPSARPVALLSLALPAANGEELAKLPLGVRDAHLLRLRQVLFGDSMDCLAGCPGCRDELEFAVSAASLLQQADDTSAREYQLQGPHHRVHFRTPDTTDLMGLSRLDLNQTDYQEEIIARCVIDVEGPEGNVEPANIPQDVVDLLADEMERRDPLAMIRLDLRCAQCGHVWQSLFDVASLLWTDVDRWARMFLHEVHLLARAYGWTERDVLRLSDARREHYLGMVGA